MFSAIFFLVLRAAAGLAIGSFLNVVACRYDPEKPLFHVRAWRGRSRCLHCGVTLRWFELIPLASFLIQRGRCRACKARLSLQYPLVELASALAFVFLPLLFSGAALAIWILASLMLILLSAIDARLMLIPDELSIGLGVLGVSYTALLTSNQSFLRHYAMLFGLWDASPWVNRAVAAAVGFAFFGLVILLSRGRGMGMGDMKFAASAGLLTGWPDILLALMISFITGSIFGAVRMLQGKKGLKSSVPFGPFIALGVFLTVTLGYRMMEGYFDFFTWLYDT